MKDVGDATRVRLRDYVDLLTGFPFKSKDFLESGETRLVRGDNVAPGQLSWNRVKFWDTADSDFGHYALSVGDVVVAMDRPWIEAGLKACRVGPDDTPSLLVQRVARLRAKGGLDQRFLYYLILTPAFTHHIKSISTGTAIPHISARQIGEFEFTIPPLDEQRRIAGVLGALDDLIEANSREADKLDALADALGSRFLASLSETAYVPITELANVSKGYSYKSAELIPGQGSWLVNLKNVARGAKFNIAGVKPLAGSPKPQHLVDDGDIIVAQTDLTQARDVIGRAVRVRRGTLHGELVASLDLVVVRPKEEYLREYLLASLRSPRFLDYALGRCNGTTVLHMAAGTVQQFDVPLPDTTSLTEMASTVEPLRAAASAARLEAEGLVGTRDELLPLLLSGRVRVSEVVSDVENLAGT